MTHPPPFIGPHFVRARTALLGIQTLVSSVSVEVVEHPNRDEYVSWWTSFKPVRGVLWVAASSGLFRSGTDCRGRRGGGAREPSSPRAPPSLSLSGPRHACRDAQVLARCVDERH